ncbi:murein hydrolase activator EnvC family protein [Candidatus Poriferisodalis sp.]|uniref:murein hydrolase activator EnvC family protein n=1 Tax=Candidatus Poriferisodalis sp. TaxID=3101277 RepID=UPI003B017D30
MVSVAVLAGGVGPAWAQAGLAQMGPPVAYIWPVQGTVIDPFRLPAHPWGPGNRGVELATQPGSAFWAAARGVVSFAGQAGGRLHVTVSHPDGLRVSYSGVESISVRRGERVAPRQQLGTTGDRLHVGVRRGETYLDPARIFGQGGRSGRRPALSRPQLVPASLPVYRLQLRWLHSGAGIAVL